MRKLLRPLIGAVLLAIAGCTAPAPQSSTTAAGTDERAHEAHEAYVAAINSNNLDSIMAMMTEDVVFLAPNEPVMVGKGSVRPWADGYLKAFKIHWEKTTQEFVVAGEWAFERYAYSSADTALGDGGVVLDTGKGLNIYHHDADGKWRVARDVWNSDLQPPVR